MLDDAIVSVMQQPLRARVRHGRIVLDEPTDLPTGTSNCYLRTKYWHVVATTSTMENALRCIVRSNKALRTSTAVTSKMHLSSLIG